MEYIKICLEEVALYEALMVATQRPSNIIQIIIYCIIACACYYAFSHAEEKSKNEEKVKKEV